ncbi:hypothetical protein MLD38_026305 [Melastoma candidum]|uniref:Uncharacterized protein n=1 Tax=Melastoma candidum TaxID=119954 RepID=A0ACB9NYM4_9MYRT|nr:hypothetical protein MLD38_026305 [Melastoma candidum]
MDGGEFWGLDCWSNPAHAMLFVAAPVEVMDWSSWFRKQLLKDSSKAAATSTPTPDPTEAKDPPSPSKKQPRAFTVDTFNCFPLQDDGDEPGRDIESGATAEGNHKRDLSEWQERHATLALARVKELA